MPFVEVNGLKLHFQELAGRGSFLILSHGLLVDNLSTWYFSGAANLGCDRRVVLYDLRGHGRTDRKPTGYCLESLASDLLALIDHCAPGAERVDLGGFSYGASISLYLALHNPSRVGRLVLVEPKLPPTSEKEVQRLINADLPTLLDALPSEVRRSVLASPRRAIRLVQDVRGLVERTSLIPDLCSEPCLPDELLAGLERPVLLLNGRSSPCLSDGQRLAELLPQAESRVLDGGHHLLRTNGREVIDCMGGFLNG